MSKRQIIEKEDPKKEEETKKKSTLTPRMKAGLKHTLTKHKNVYDALKDN